MENAKITLSVDVTNVDEYIKKANKYVELLREAKTLAKELASVKFKIELNENQY